MVHAPTKRKSNGSAISNGNGNGNTTNHSFDIELAEITESQQPVPPDGGWGWMVVFGSFMIHIISE